MKTNSLLFLIILTGIILLLSSCSQMEFDEQDSGDVSPGNPPRASQQTSLHQHEDSIDAKTNSETFQ